MKYIIRTIRTGVISVQHADLLECIRRSRLTLNEGDIVAVTSKVVGIWEGRTVPIGSIQKDELIKQEAQLWLERKHVPGMRVMHTITRGILIPSSGIDESNGNGQYILYPKDPNKSAQRLLRFLKKEYAIKKLGVILTDSHSTPLRRGVTGFALAYAGFPPLLDYRGTKDIFGRSFHFSQSNIPDALAAAAVLAMGEGAEQTPLAVISGTPWAGRTASRTTRPFSSYDVSLKEDLYAPFLRNVSWKKGRKGIKSSIRLRK
nr:F420-0:Gamma-glutamyl ligase [uncultured bacterium]